MDHETRPRPPVDARAVGEHAVYSTDAGRTSPPYTTPWPTCAKIGSDLYHRRSTKFTGAGFIYAGAEHEHAKLSDAYREEQGATCITLDIDTRQPGNPVTLVRASKQTGNAILLSFAEDKTIVATATGRRAPGSTTLGCQMAAPRRHLTAD